MISIRSRLLLAASLVLLAFVALCGAGLERAFRQSALNAEEGRLRGITYALLGAAEPDARNALDVDDANLPEPRLSQPQSGLEAAILDEAGTVLWHSPSVDGEPPVVIRPEVGKWKFERLDGVDRFALSFGLRWIGPHDAPKRYTVLVLEDPAAYELQLALFRRTLWSWLAGVAAALLAALLLVLRWGMAPLGRLARELHGVETGTQPQIGAAYPRELTPLTGALNALIVSERAQLARYRNALGDLAHSLKTPLAVLRGMTADARVAGDARRQLDEQVGRMQQIVDHQLVRAATAGRRALAQPVRLLPVARKITAALEKVYADKALTYELNVPAGLQGRIDSGDLYEICGNVLDNAAKWAARSVRLSAHRNGAALILEAEDDGPGFPADAERLLGRGVKADSRVPGQGLGLAAVDEIVQAYEGQIELARSRDLGGAKVVLRIPGA